VSVQGNGTVTGSGIACPGRCHASLPTGGPVTLVATPGPGAAFTGWTGACAGQGGSCTLNLGQDLATVATFAGAPVKGPPPPALFLKAKRSRVAPGHRVALIATWQGFRVEADQG